ncbi:nucleoporin Ndc1 [Copidosoma floridanum]|uniref:nucleoporin Ndc1 n=1 Tax=Copidosoma floridanum TaxID=29053 RepID=UPI0006C996C4|nr:nucleoporin Ndc1 [Copidosoma floridanum]
MDQTTAEISKHNSNAVLAPRMFFAVGMSIVVHFLLSLSSMSGVILMTNLDITHPLEWLRNTWNVVTCLRMWTNFIIFSVVVFFLGITCRKNYLNPPKYASSRFVKFCYFFTPTNLKLGMLYMLLGGVLAWLHMSVEGGRFGSLIKKCDRIGKYCLVEEHYFLLLEGFWIGIYFFFNSNYMGLHNLQFPIIPLSKITQVKRGIRSMISNALLDGLWPVFYFFGFYAMFGSYCRDILVIPASLSLEDIPLDKFSKLLNISLFFHAWLYAVLFVLIIQSMHLLFQAFLTQWIQFDIETVQFIEKPTTITLTDALAMESTPILQQLGYLDLVTVAQKDKMRRCKLFTLSQPGGHPYNWNRVVEKSLSLIEKFSEQLNSACSAQKSQVTQQSNPMSNTLSSPITNRTYTYQMRNLVSPMVANFSITPQKADINCKTESTDNFVIQFYKNLRTSVVNYFLSKKPISYIFAEQFENKIRHLLINAQAIIWASDAISSLAALSLTEDPYGIVQKNLHEIIEVLLRLKQSLDKLQKLNISMRKPVSDDRLLRQTLTTLRSTVRRSLYRIVSHFKNYINDLELAPLTIDQLQPFFTYRE